MAFLKRFGGVLLTTLKKYVQFFAKFRKKLNKNNHESLVVKKFTMSESIPMYTKEYLFDKKVDELKAILKEGGTRGYCKLTKEGLVDKIIQIQTTNVRETPVVVLEPCAVPASVNIEMLNELMGDYMKPRLQFYNDTGRPVSVEDEVSEWMTAKCTLGKEVGKGHVAIDVTSSSTEGIDAMCVIMNGSQSNEKSLIQNFKNSGNSLDTIFLERRDSDAVTGFMKDLQAKLKDAVVKFALTGIYIFAFISTYDDVYLCSFKYNIDAIEHVSSAGFTRRGNSVYVNGFIKKEFGNVKVYKAKKRVELRLTKKCITDNPFAIKLYSKPVSNY